MRNISYKLYKVERVGTVYSRGMKKSDPTLHDLRRDIDIVCYILINRLLSHLLLQIVMMFINIK